jgi:hypothetical protein
VLLGDNPGCSGSKAEMEFGEVSFPLKSMLVLCPDAPLIRFSGASLRLFSGPSNPKNLSLSRIELESHAIHQGSLEGMNDDHYTKVTITL